MALLSVENIRVAASLNKMYCKQSREATIDDVTEGANQEPHPSKVRQEAPVSFSKIFRDRRGDSGYIFGEHIGVEARKNYPYNTFNQ